VGGLAWKLEWVGWHVSCIGLREWDGVLAGVGGLACELQWLE
jgi:hypothetical protein